MQQYQSHGPSKEPSPMPSSVPVCRVCKSDWSQTSSVTLALRGCRHRRKKLDFEDTVLDRYRACVRSAGNVASKGSITTRLGCSLSNKLTILLCRTKHRQDIHRFAHEVTPWPHAPGGCPVPMRHGGSLCVGCGLVLPYKSYCLRRTRNSSRAASLDSSLCNVASQNSQRQAAVSISACTYTDSHM